MKKNYRFMDNRFTFYTISGVLIVASILLLLVNGLNYGIDFKGGYVLHVVLTNPSEDNKIKELFDEIFKSVRPDLKADQIVVQTVDNKKNEKREFIIQYPNFLDNMTSENDKIKVKEAINKDFQINLDERRLEVTAENIVKEALHKKYVIEDVPTSGFIGATVGYEMKRQGIIAAILSCVGLLLYLGWRFDFYAATGVVLAVVHDLIITLGFISATKLIPAINIDFDTTVLAAILTLLGYSVNDSIVIFDRIRENTRISKNGTPYKVIVDNSINQSLSRTLNTTITTLLALLALLIFSGTKSSIFAFSLVLIVASIVGTYSSNCLAAPMVEDLFHKGKGEKNSETGAIA